MYFTFRLVGKEGKKQTVNELTSFWSIVKEQFSISGISKQQNNNLGTQIIHYWYTAWQNLQYAGCKYVSKWFVFFFFAKLTPAFQLNSNQPGLKQK